MVACLSTVLRLNGIAQDAVCLNNDFTDLPSLAIFGTSKTTTRDFCQKSGWVGRMMYKLHNNASMVSSPTIVGTTAYGLTSRKHMLNGFGRRCAKGVGTYLEFEITGERAFISQVIHRDSSYATYDIYVDGVLLGSDSNLNVTVRGPRAVEFAGDGVTRSFVLPDMDCYNIAVTIDSVAQTVSMAPSTIAKGTSDCYAVRTTLLDGDGEPVRIIYFPTPPAAGSSVSVTYEAGHVIGFAQSDYSEINNQAQTEDVGPVYIDSLSSVAVYQHSYPLSPVLTDERNMIRIDFAQAGTHTVKIVLTGGVNPYFDFDFASSTYINMMNAAFGGYDLARFLNEPRWRDWRCLRYMPNPDKVLMEYGANDDRYENDRVTVRHQLMTLEQLKQEKMKLVKDITQVSDTTVNVGLAYDYAESFTSQSLIAPSVKNGAIHVGDYIRIGEYHSSWHEFVVRRVTAVDQTTGLLQWDEPVLPSLLWHYNSIDSMQHVMFAVRRLTQFKSNLRKAIQKLNEATPSSEITLIGMSPFRDNAYCSGWGYDEAMEDVAAELGCSLVKVADALVAYDEAALADATEIDVPSTGAMTYTVAADQFTNINREMRVLVNGVDVTGRRAWVHHNSGWHVKEAATISDVIPNNGNEWSGLERCSLNSNNSGVTIVFYGDSIPSVDDRITLQVANTGWTRDGVHQSDEGDQVYADVIFDFLNSSDNAGDVNGDGAITMADVTLIIYVILNGTEGIKAESLLKADVNGDGLITMADATTIIQLILQI